MTPMSATATTNGELWSVRARAWATYQEQTHLPLDGAVLDAARVTRGTRLLDAGCGAGLALLLAALRGARVAGVDAAPGFVEIARSRVPEADVRVADLEAIPFEDGAFGAVIAMNSVFYAGDMAAAMRELARVARPGGRVVLANWGPPEQCEYVAVVSATRPLAPPPPAGAPGAFALAAPGALAALVEAAGLEPVEQGMVACPFNYPDLDAAWAALASSGNAQRAIAASGEARVRAAVDEVNGRFTQPDGSVRYQNVFLWLAARKV